MKIKILSLVLVSFFSLSVYARAYRLPVNLINTRTLSQPACVDEKGRAFQTDINDQVLDWKESTRNQFHARARIYGVVTNVYRDTKNHDHFQISIGDMKHETIEVIFNGNFGELPNLRLGDKVEACGDYITSNAPTDRYPASPDDAIIHWVHMSTNTAKHAHGYLVINGRLFGFDHNGR